MSGTLLIQNPFPYPDIPTSPCAGFTQLSMTFSPSQLKRHHPKILSFILMIEDLRAKKYGFCICSRVFGCGHTCKGMEYQLKVLPNIYFDGRKSSFIS